MMPSFLKLKQLESMIIVNAIAETRVFEIALGGFFRLGDKEIELKLKRIKFEPDKT